MSQVGQYNFSGFMHRDASVVKNQIIFFGSNNDNSTYVLQPQHKSNALEAIHKYNGIDYERAANNSSFCIFKDKMYFFAKNNYTDVYDWDIDTGKSTLYHS